MKMSYVWGVIAGVFILSIVVLNYFMTPKEVDILLAPASTLTMEELSVNTPDISIDNKEHVDHHTTIHPPVEAPKKLSPHEEKKMKNDIAKQEKKLTTYKQREESKIKKLENKISKEQSKIQSYHDKLEGLNKELETKKEKFESDLHEMEKKLDASKKALNQ